LLVRITRSGAEVSSNLTMKSIIQFCAFSWISHDSADTNVIMGAGKNSF